MTKALELADEHIDLASPPPAQGGEYELVGKIIWQDRYGVSAHFPKGFPPAGSKLFIKRAVMEALPQGGERK